VQTSTGDSGEAGYWAKDPGPKTTADWVNKKTGKSLGQGLDLGYVDKDKVGTTYLSLLPDGTLGQRFEGRAKGLLWESGLMDFANMVPGLNAYTIPLTIAHSAANGDWLKAAGTLAAQFLPGIIGAAVNNTDLLGAISGSSAATGSDFNPTATTPAGMVLEAATGIQGNLANSLGGGVLGGVTAALSGGDALQGATLGALNNYRSPVAGNLTIGDIAKGALIVQNLSSDNPNYGRALTMAGELAKSRDTVIAGKALGLVRAIENNQNGQNVVGIANALTDLTRTVGANNVNAAKQNPTKIADLLSNETLAGNSADDELTNQILATQTGIDGTGTQVAAAGAVTDATSDASTSGGLPKSNVQAQGSAVGSGGITLTDSSGNPVRSGDAVDPSERRNTLEGQNLNRQWNSQEESPDGFGRSITEGYFLADPYAQRNYSLPEGWRFVAEADEDGTTPFTTVLIDGVRYAITKPGLESDPDIPQGRLPMPRGITTDTVTAGELTAVSEADVRRANNALVENFASDLINNGVPVNDAFKRAAAANGLTESEYDRPSWSIVNNQVSTDGRAKVGSDTVTLLTTGATAVSQTDKVGDSVADAVTLITSAPTSVSQQEAVKSDTVTLLPDSGQTVNLLTTGATSVSAVASVTGSEGGGSTSDTVTLLTTGATAVSPIDTVVSGPTSDTVTLLDGSGKASVVDTSTGGVGSETITLLTVGNGVTSLVDTIGPGSDTVTLLTGGNNVVSVIDSGRGGSDTVSLIGSTGADTVSLIGPTGSDTVTLSAVDSNIGSSRTDTTTLVTTGAITVSTVDTVTNPPGSDTVTLFGSPATAATTTPAAEPELPIRKVGDLGKYVSPLAGYQELVQQMFNTAMDEKIQQQQTPYQESGDNSFWGYGQQEKPLDSIFGGLASIFSEPEVKAATGGSIAALLAVGGASRSGRGSTALVPHSGKMRVDFRRGDAVTGPGDGQSDDIPAMLADGEFVFPADVVSALGNGSTKAGSDKLYEMMHAIRARARKAHPKSLPPPAKSPLEYLRGKK
jgi:hypothetical protein